jgi:hypothetical protein
MKWRIWDVDEEEGDVGEMLKGAGTKFLTILNLRDATHEYVLANISIMMPWM